MRLLLLSVLSLLFYCANSQSKEEILAEGFELYYSEKASWLGTDLLYEAWPDLADSVGGYLSYREGEVFRCIFFNREEIPSVLLTFDFQKDFQIENAVTGNLGREMTGKEMDLFEMRQEALRLLNSDTIFSFYKNTNPNAIPIIIDGKRKVFVITGPKVGGVVVFGNDYLIQLNNKNKVKSIKKLHKNIIPIEYNEESKGSVTMHNHSEETGEYITSTDVCTLLLYGGFTGWQQHLVYSKTQVSIWDVEKNSLLVLTMKAWNKIYNHLTEKEEN